jgi:hypothetical protein
MAELAPPAIGDVLGENDSSRRHQVRHAADQSANREFLARWWSAACSAIPEMATTKSSLPISEKCLCAQAMSVGVGQACGIAHDERALELVRALDGSLICFLNSLLEDAFTFWLKEPSRLREEFFWFFGSVKYEGAFAFSSPVNKEGTFAFSAGRNGEGLFRYAKDVPFDVFMPHSTG